MKSGQTASFQYTKENGEKSNRVVYVISSPSDMYFTIDLTEFDENERAWYIEKIKEAYENLRQEIKEIGLSTNYRNFKKHGITSISS